MGYYKDFKFPDGFNILSEDDWNDFMQEYIKNPEEYEYWDFDGEYEWRKIPGYPNYEASDAGTIRSNFPGKEPHELKSWGNQRGHQSVCVTDDNGVRSKKLVHRLVASAFLENPNGDNIVRHLNDVPRDNRPENLAWGTQKDNREDMIRNGNDFHRSVYCYETDVEYRSGAEAAKELGVSRSAVSLACNRKTYTLAGGKHFCFSDEKEERLKDEEWLKPHDLRLGVIARNRDSGEELRFDSRKEAAEYLGIPACGISSAINGTIPHAHGWIFRNSEEEG